MIDYNALGNKLTVEQEELIRNLSKAADPKELSTFKDLVSTAVGRLITNSRVSRVSGTMCFTSCGSALTMFNTDGRTSKRRNLNQGGRFTQVYEDYVQFVGPKLKERYLITDGKLKGQTIEVKPSERLEDLVFSAVVSYYEGNFDKFWNYQGNELKPSVYEIPLLEFIFYPGFEEGYMVAKLVTITVTSGSITCSSKIIDESRLKRAEFEYGMEVQCDDLLDELMDIVIQCDEVEL